MREREAQGTVEYAIVLSVFLAILLACAAVWRTAERGGFTGAAERAASHALDGAGAVDISLY